MFVCHLSRSTVHRQPRPCGKEKLFFSWYAIIMAAIIMVLMLCSSCALRSRQGGVAGWLPRTCRVSPVSPLAPYAGGKVRVCCAGPSGERVADETGWHTHLHIYIPWCNIQILTSHEPTTTTIVINLAGCKLHALMNDLDWYIAFWHLPLCFKHVPENTWSWPFLQTFL